MNKCVQGIIDKRTPQISTMIEKKLRRELLEGIEEILCDGEYHVVRIKRDEGFIPLPNFPHEPTEVRVTYRAEILEVEHRHCTVKDAWNEYYQYKQTKGRNHRKKDRARARQKRAKRKKLKERLRA